MAAPFVPLTLDAVQVAKALPEAIRARLADIEVVDEVASTNDILYDGAETCDRVRIARHQTGGRGRQGRRWETAGGALCFSVLHAFPAEVPAALALWTGIALIERLREMGLGRPCLNWPNDLMYGADKFGGVLIECRARGDATACAVGVGVNVREVPKLDRPATSIAEACGRIPEPNRLAAGLIEAVSACLVRLDEREPAGLGACFDRCDGLRDRDVNVAGAGGTYAGRACGVDDQGRLRVEGADGVREFDCADVRLRRR